MLVVDASLVVDYLLNGGRRGAWSAERIRGAESLHAPHLLDLEVLAAARGLVARGETTPEQARRAVNDLKDLPVRRYPVVQLLARIWALRGTLTPYDASYIALAEALDLPLATTDARLSRASGHLATVEGFDG
jgi:predicted nucleic acid-binding protein